MTTRDFTAPETNTRSGSEHRKNVSLPLGLGGACGICGAPFGGEVCDCYLCPDCHAEAFGTPSCDPDSATPEEAPPRYLCDLCNVRAAAPCGACPACHLRVYERSANGCKAPRVVPV